MTCYSKNAYIEDSYRYRLGLVDPQAPSLTLSNELSHDPLYVHMDYVGLVRPYPYTPIPFTSFSHSEQFSIPMMSSALVHCSHAELP